MLIVHYYRYDQDYSGWDIWLWEKGEEGAAYRFNAFSSIHIGSDSKIAEARIDISSFRKKEAGLLIRRGGWHDRDVSADRLFTLLPPGTDGNNHLYLYQNDPEVYLTNDPQHYTPSFETAIFQSFNEIFLRLQVASGQNLSESPFRVFENGREIPVKEIIPLRGAMDFVINLEGAMTPGYTYTVAREGYRTGAVAYGFIYDTDAFESRFTYEGQDLGAAWTKEATAFKLWAPTAARAYVNLYQKGDGPCLIDQKPMWKDIQGTWSLLVYGDLNGMYYTYTAETEGRLVEAADPYALASGVNGKRSMVIHMEEASPEGWASVGHIPLMTPTDAVLYEVHVRDATIHPASGIMNKGKFMGLTCENTVSPEGCKTGLAHFKELGITHVHFMPVADFFTVDETKIPQEEYNWGYDPVHYNVPEGSYATDPYDGFVRIKELKAMIKALKQSGIGVVLDVVYNHTYFSFKSDFHKLVPGYYHRTNRMGKFGDGSGCGNETASERPMVRHFMLESLRRWVRHYKVDGFRFDLMGLHDVDTMKAIRSELDNLCPSLLLYGEGWTGGPSLLDGQLQAAKGNASKLPRIGFFNDLTRDAIKGHNFHGSDPGFITGGTGRTEGVKFGIAGAIAHPGVDYGKIAHDGYPWAAQPWNCVNYAASHDNLTLCDKLLASRPGLEPAEYEQLVKLASAIVLTSQGIPFMPLGTDFMRSKKGHHNSYNAPDSVNQVDWSEKARHLNVFEYHKGLIQLRKRHPAFRMSQAEDIRKNLFFEYTSDTAIAYSLNNHAGGDSWHTLFVAFNAEDKEITLSLPFKGEWHMVVNHKKAGTDILETLTGASAVLPPRSALVLYAE